MDTLPNFSGKPFYLQKKDFPASQIIAMVPKFFLNEAQILVAGNNFGTGTCHNLGHVIDALYDSKIRCVIAPSFGDDFYECMFKNGMLCIVIEDDLLDLLFFQEPQHLRICLQSKSVSYGSKCIYFKLTEAQMGALTNARNRGA